MNTLHVIAPNEHPSDILKSMLDAFIDAYDDVLFVRSPQDANLSGKKLVFAAELEQDGFDIPMLEFISNLKKSGPSPLEGSCAAILVHSSNEFGTKRSAQNIIFNINNLGCEFIGHPLVEATGSLSNFRNWQKQLPDYSLEQICLELCGKLGKRLSSHRPLRMSTLDMVVLYSSTHACSNTLDLWHMIGKNLDGCNIREFKIENETITDCKGCSYKTCLHYGKQNSCFYGGHFVDNVLPAIQKADCVAWLCPNYNDAIAANLTATINRLTVLYNKMSFNDKSMLGVIVSGNSGSDSVAKQLIGALNVNKGFRLPPKAIICETANDPGAIFNVPGIQDKALEFSEHLKKSLMC